MKRLVRQHVVKTIYLILGSLALVSGLIGLFLPVLPTTPFLLVAAFCFSKSSERMHDWLMNHRIFGPPIRDWNKHRVIGLRAKIFSLTTISIGLVSVYWTFPDRLAMGRYVTMACMVAVMIFILLQKSKRESGAETPTPPDLRP